MAKTDKLNKRILQLLAAIIEYDLNDPRIKFASVTKVELTDDYRYCTAHISILGDSTRQRTVMRGLQHARGFLQTRLGSKLALRHVPILRLKQDRSIEKSVELSTLIDQANTPGEADAAIEAPEPNQTRRDVSSEKQADS